MIVIYASLTFFTGSGVIHFQDFQHLVAKRVKTLNGADELREAFRVYDRERKGYITSGEFRQIVSQIGDNVTPEDIDEMVKEADLNKNGRIEYEGLLNIEVSICINLNFDRMPIMLPSKCFCKTIIII